MRIVTLLVLIALIAGGPGCASKEIWCSKAPDIADTFETHYAKGIKAYQDMRYDAAIESFKTALSKNHETGDRPLCLRRLGDCYKEKRMYAEALRTYQKLIDEYPDHKLAPDTRSTVEKVQSLGHF